MLLFSAAAPVVETTNAAATDSQGRNGSLIEDVLRRAQQIHKQQGGFWGYGFDDWARAWRETSQADSQSDKQLDDENAIGLLPDRENVYTKEVVGLLNPDGKRQNPNIVRCLFAALLLALCSVVAGCERRADSAPPPAPPA